MHPPSLHTAVRRIRSLAGPPEAAPDGELLARFRANRDDQAFAALVQRHGPAVLGVCRRVLRDPDAADDAFQATFLVLARRARSIRKPASVGCWLHGVAVRVAARHKGRLARQPRPVETVEASADPRDDVLWRDVRRVLDEEVNRLPERLRLPIYLCYFEGKTRDEAAEALGWKLTTLRGRLEDGRLRLRTRLALRGIELSAALLAVSAAEGLAVSESLLTTSVRAAGGVASESVQSLAKGVAVSGTIAKTKITLGTLLLAVGLGTTLLVYRGEAGETPGPGPAKAPEAPPKEKDPPPPAKPPKGPEWGEPASDFRIRLNEPATIKLGEAISLVIDAKYGGNEKWTVDRRPENAEVEWDGKWFTPPPQRLRGGVALTELAPGSEFVPWDTIRPDGTWGHTRDKPGAVGDPGEATKEVVPFRLTPGKHTVRVAYWFGPDVKAVSNAVAVEIGPDGWGDPVAEVRARLRIAKTRLKPGEPLAFELDLRNEGLKNWNLTAIPFDCEVLVGDVRYTYSGPIDYKAQAKELKPGGELVPFVTATTDQTWMARPQVKEGTSDAPAPTLLRLGAGKHRVRVAFPIDGDRVRPVSNTVEIEVEPPQLDPAIRALALAADRIWVVPSPTREAPVPKPVEVLKGPPADTSGLFDLRLLPADDPKAKWIVFLAAEEEGKPSPEVKIWPTPPWSHPYTPETAEAIRRAILPAEWGSVHSGLQVGLRLRQAEVPVGGPVVAEVTVRNVGKEERTLPQHRLNIYDYWPHLSFEVTAPSGRWIVSKPEGEMNEADSPHRFTLKPGEAYVQAVRLDRWTAHPAIPKDGEYPPNVFTAAGEYTITARYIPDKNTNLDGLSAMYPSNAVKLTMPKPVDSGWGKPANGVRARLRLAKPALKAGELLKFDLDLRNDGTEARKIRTEFFKCRLVLDGRTYVYQGPVDHPVVFTDLAPRAEKAPFLTVTADGNWVDENGVYVLAPPPATLRLPTGRHRLSVQYPVDEKTWVETPTIEFDAAVEGWGEPANSIRAKLRLAKATLQTAEPLKFDLDLLYVGMVTRKLDVSPFLCELLFDGQRYVSGGDPDHPVTLKEINPGDLWAPFVSVTPSADLWASMTSPRVPFKLTTGKHSLAARYPVTADRTVYATTPTVEFEVKSDNWGEPAGGVAARVRLAKEKFKAGDPLAFELDLKVTGDTTYEDGPIPFHCRIELDGAEYRYTFPVSYPTSIQKLAPGKEYVPYVKVTTGDGWETVNVEGKPSKLTLTPGKHTLRVTYPLPGNVRPVSPKVEFEVAAGDPKAGGLAALIEAADRIVVADIDWQGGTPRLIPKRTLKGPNNRWQPDVQPIAVPAGADALPERPAGALVLFLKAEEDGVEAPKLSPAAPRGWFRPATEAEIAAVVAALPKPTDHGPPQNNLSLALRPAATTVGVGEEIRLDVVLTNQGKDALRVLQQRYNVYDYWPFLSFTVTGPDGQTVTLAKPEGPFDREDFIDEVALKAGESYTHAVRLDRWPGSPFREPGTYKVEAKYSAPIGFKNLRPGTEIRDWPFWNGELKSNTVTIEVKASAKSPFDVVRPVTKAGQVPLLYVVLTDPKDDPSRLAELVVQNVGAALAEADRRKFTTGNVVFLIRTAANADRGNMTGLSREQLEEIKKASPEDALRLAGRHAWTLGRVPPAP
jgi:RNA polymerase sigma factor (sigma-70 family)